jgi:serine protease Do
VIEGVNRKPVQSASDVKRDLGNVPDGKDALVLVYSNGGSTFRVMHASEAQNTGE